MMLPRGGEPQVQQANSAASAAHEPDLHLASERSGPCTALRKWMGGHRRYFDALAILESLVAITSGIIVWLGTWDLLDNHLLPDTITAKMLLIVFSLLALFASRTLYDKQLLKLRNVERRRRKSITRVRQANAQAAVGCESEARESSSQMAAPASERASRQGLHGDELGSSGAGLVAPSATPIEHMHRLYFDAPHFSARRFARAAFALLASLTLWIGMWDMIDNHIIPTLFAVCAREEWQCAFVKVGCVVLGLLGLYATRTLYGSDSVKNAHFSRMQ
ncbi:hypothetical protein KFE25_007146 [Diacronema lutheri]|uniref:Uncharacterized protein n=1 Tax=Diacronema lutheri TaxID=2081491 RepID=A0A8J5XXG4_DIALT|nr:hypothetical protein KFE25_007146 [Diacronema lutheri]